MPNFFVFRRKSAESDESPFAQIWCPFSSQVDYPELPQRNCQIYWKRGLFHNKLGISGHFIDNCPSQEEGICVQERSVIPFPEYFLSCCCFRCFCSHIGKLRTLWLRSCPFYFLECLTLGLFMKNHFKEAIFQMFYSSLLPLCTAAVIFEMQIASFWNYFSTFHVLEFLECRIA